MVFLSIKKPGRLRIDYDKPEDLLILASGGQLAIFDPKRRSRANFFSFKSYSIGIDFVEAA
jgi:outer membrane lipoprotein-sorting protein